jgi:Mrp family chromosome partitioning ATPase/capsular polysaccharide biosynthesis protein
MLGSVRSIPAEGVWPVAADSAETITLSDAVAFLQRRFWLIAVVLVSIMALAATYVLSTPAQYVAGAELLIGPGKEQALWQDGSVVDLTIDNAQVESQVEVLLSERIANDVIATLGLVNDPEFNHTAAGSDYERQRATLAQFESNLSARRIGQSYVIEVSFRSRDPEKAARIANAVTDAYLRDQQNAKRDVAQQTSKWMEERIADLGVQLNSAAAAVQQFRVSQGITDAGAGNQPRLIDKLTELEARAQAYRKVYETLLEKLTESQQQTSFPGSDARVITSASRPLIKSYPKTSLIMLLSVFVGLVVGVAVAAGRTMLDGSVQSAKQIRHSLGLPCLGTLPAQRIDQAKNGATKHRIEVVDAPLSPFSDAMRNLKISVQNAMRGRGGSCLGVVSLMPDEETSTVALNLGALFITSGAKTLLVDADFNERGLTRLLAPEARWGLVEALRDGPADTIVYDRKTKTHLLPFAGLAPTPNSGDLFDSPAMQSLLQRLKEKFATIVIDLPALKRAVGARAVAPLLDGCILVAVHGRTSLRELEDAVELLRSDDVELLGVVITQVPDGIPPLLGVHLDEVRDFDYAGYVHRLVRMAAR